MRCARAERATVPSKSSRNAPRPSPRSVVTVKESDAGIDIDTGNFVCRVARTRRQRDHLDQARRPRGLRDGKLVLLRQDRALERR